MLPSKEGALTRGHLVIFLFMAVPVLIVECAVVYAGARMNMALFAMSVHVVTVMALSAWVYYAYGWRDCRLSALLLVMTAAAGPFGAMICMMIAVGYLFFKPTGITPYEWIDSMLSNEENKETNNVTERINFNLDNHAANSAVEPFKDILAGGSVLQKQMTIAKISRYFNPQFAPLLLKAVQDANPAVRVQAATALAKLERHFMMQYMQLEKEMVNRPDFDEARLQLAKVYDDYADAGLLDECSLHNLRIKAIQTYEAYLAHYTNPEIKVRLAISYLRYNQPEKSYALLKQGIKSGEITDPAAILWYMEAMFALNKFSEIRCVLKSYANELASLDDEESGMTVGWLLSSWKSSINTGRVKKPMLEQKYAA